MFNNSGGYIKFLAKLLLFLGIAVSMIGAAILSSILNSIIENKSVIVLIAVGCILGGALITWIFSLFLYSWGEVVESVAYLSEQHADALEEQNEKLIRSNKHLLLELQKLNNNLHNKKEE